MVRVFRFRVTGESADDGHVDMQEISERASSLVDSTVDALGASRMPNPLPLRRVVTEMLEAGKGGEGLLDESPGSSRFSSHTLRVSMLSLMIGLKCKKASQKLTDIIRMANILSE